MNAHIGVVELKELIESGSYDGSSRGGDDAEILEHIKAVRYNTDAAYKYKIDKAKREAKEAKRKQAYLDLVMTDQWYYYAHEYLQYLRDIRKRNADEKKDYLELMDSYRKIEFRRRSGYMSPIEGRYIPELEFEEYCTRKVMKEDIQYWIRGWDHVGF